MKQPTYLYHSEHAPKVFDGADDALMARLAQDGWVDSPKLFIKPEDRFNVISGEMKDETQAAYGFLMEYERSGMRIAAWKRELIANKFGVKASKNDLDALMARLASGELVLLSSSAAE
ncbi:MAG: hypothetical protein AAGI34_04655 [Pseudomonadota bacterium]